MIELINYRWDTGWWDIQDSFHKIRKLTDDGIEYPVFTGFPKS